MKEDFLHYVWKFAKFNTKELKTTAGEHLQIIRLGTHNQHESGPDFFNSQIEIDNQRWAGNVEIHLKSSDWYAHGHEKDDAYQNVILHVVWEHDVDIYRTDQSVIPTLILKDVVEASAEKNYHQLMQNQLKWINCEADFNSFEELKLKSWLERVFVERLEEKSKLIQQMLHQSKNNWDEVLFLMLAKNFGLKINGEAFLSLAKSIPFQVLQKCAQSQLQLEALLFGQAHLLEKKDVENAYFLQLKNEYAYLVQKFQLKNKAVLPVQFYGARPTNFPSIRLAQLASLYHQNQHLFSALMNVKNSKEISKVLAIQLHDFWQTHYTFEKESKHRKKQLSANFIHLLIINTVAPIQFSFAKFTNNFELENSSIALLSNLPSEKNKVIEKYNALREQTATNALESQALLHLKKKYCDRHNCLQCNLGIELLGR
ncbi:DUF2851 family protein [Psychroflexus planctonicus]|uniref:DUF2851 domain-containing protein n=1 Tax=Psychroflexus planctonicus TaxID=1526575 RepID=A0ABQ1SJ94_9FLAO|nr:DUF2851 family protein [Psychroflexus planctonicus]GGE36612.1 hypothetical protein GCM10010832_16000 [Psychroflexus planctonicus]